MFDTSFHMGMPPAAYTLSLIHIWNVFLAYTAGGFQKRAVTADADNHIGAEVVTVEQFGGRNVEV